ncbi:ProQ/FinO family protein [Legionella fairfieldensis]|uniref:ProQ/FinO family protein n=1 Tax=Legionella fairfieldensis TaxID=45064 RepID=UPI00048D1B6A|nr:ProQ/FinO family protein [Legionella fairfieldensis]
MRRQELHPRTAVINKTQKNKSKKARSEALVWLAATFPQVFDNTLRIRPLKVGIMEDLLLTHADKAAEAGISRSKLREAVVLFTRRIDYLTCLKAREERIDLEGNPVAVVTEEEAERAASKIKKRVEKSARNARKNLAGKIPSHYNVRPSSSSQASYAQQGTQEFVSPYPERAPAFSAQNPLSQTTRAASVIVTRKPSRQFDPDAVARLKEKLGLSRKAESQKEIADQDV